MDQLFAEFGRAIAWSLVGSVAMAVSLGILIKIFDVFTPGVNEMEELRKGNVAVAIVLASAILAFGFVIGMTLHAPA